MKTQTSLLVNDKLNKLATTIRELLKSADEESELLGLSLLETAPKSWLSYSCNIPIFDNAETIEEFIKIYRELYNSYHLADLLSKSLIYAELISFTKLINQIYNDKLVQENGESPRTGPCC